MDFSAFFKTIISGITNFIVDLAKAFFINPADVTAGSAENKNVLSAEEESMISAVELKAEKLAYETKIRVLYAAEGDVKSKERMNAIFGAFKQFNTTNLNGFTGKMLTGNKNFIADYKNRIFLDSGFHLNIEELASIYHLPHTSVETPNISWTSFKTAEPPTNIPTAKIVGIRSRSPLITSRVFAENPGSD